MTVSREAVIKIIADESGLDPAKLVPEASLTDLDISSIDVASAMFALEEEFGIVIEPDDISRDFTLGQFIDHVMSLSET